jgi:hypothetical protein
LHFIEAVQTDIRNGVHDFDAAVGKLFEGRECLVQARNLFEIVGLVEKIFPENFIFFGEFLNVLFLKNIALAPIFDRLGQLLVGLLDGADEIEDTVLYAVIATGNEYEKDHKKEQYKNNP